MKEFAPTVRYQLLNERICSYRSKFFPLRVDSIWIGFIAKESKENITKVVPLCKNSGNKEVYSYIFCLACD